MTIESNNLVGELMPELSKLSIIGKLFVIKIRFSIRFIHSIYRNFRFLLE